MVDIDEEELEAGLVYVGLYLHDTKCSQRTDSRGTQSSF